MLQRMNLNKLLLFFTILITAFSLNADEMKSDIKNTEFNVYTGMFDFSDEGKRAILIGFQHQNENLNRDTFLGNLSPITGGMITADSASYIYTGVQAQYKLGAINFTPSFAPGLYFEGDGKDLGHIIEFKSELQFSFNVFQNSELGFSYNHLSNASLGDKNPGANSYMFNFLKKF
jgi:lipid A 3-O-deacylase